MGKKYCIFSTQYLPHMGGVENYTFHIAQALAAKGQEITIVTSNVMAAKDYEKTGMIKIYRMPCFNLMNGRFPVLKMNYKFWKMHRLIFEQDYELVIINTRFYFHSLYGVFFSRIKKIRTIIVEHGTGHLSLHHPVLNRMEDLFEHMITFLEKKLCDEFYGVSEACLDWLTHFHIKGRGILYNAIDLVDVKQKLENPVCSYREQFHISKDAVVVSFTGRLLKEKGILTLMEVIDKICTENPQVFLLIAGDGEEEKEVKKRCSLNIRWLGRITPEEIIALLRETDIFCLPSDSEGMPTSVLEAIACHTYVVTTKKGGAKEILRDSSYGTIIDDNDFLSIYHALRGAIADKNHREKAADLAYNVLADNFTWNVVAEKLIGMVKD